MAIGTATKSNGFAEERRGVVSDQVKERQVSSTGLVREDRKRTSELTEEQKKSLRELEDKLIRLWKADEGDTDRYWKDARKLKEEAITKYDSLEWGRAVERVYTRMVKEWVSDQNNERVVEYMRGIQERIDSDDKEDEDEAEDALDDNA